MKRAKRHGIKEETSGNVNPKEHDLAYYIHDRVELMHQVFSVLKPKELKAMAPECVRHITVNDLQELCTEELLGISSKRLCAILDGAEPPSDTESSSESSQERLETISLDSISSDDEILSQVSTKKKKHKHHSKGKSRKRKSRDSGDEDGNQDKSRRTGLTVLEILELQARARAIRAQLQKEQAAVASTGRPSESATGNSSDGEVEIKEEAAEVVEISSEDEKPNVQELQEKIAVTSKETTNSEANSKTVTKKVNDLIITVPKNTSRKIKLKRTSPLEKNQKTAAVDKNVPTSSTSSVEVNTNSPNKAKVSTNSLNTAKVSTNQTLVKQNVNATVSNTVEITETVDKGKDKKKKRKKDKQKEKEGSDHDEITLQLSDTEKMDLLEDLVEKQFEKTSETEDSSADSDSEDESVDKNKKDKDLDTNKKVLVKVTKEKSKVKSKSNNEVMKGTNLNEKEMVKSNDDKDSDSVNISETLDKDTSVTEKNVTDLSDTGEVLKENDEVIEINQNSKEICDNTIKDPEIIESQNGSNNDATKIVSEDNKETHNTEESSSDFQKEKDTVESQKVEVTNTIIEKEQSDIEKHKSDDNTDIQSQLETGDVKAQSTNNLVPTDTKDSEGNIDKSMEEKSEGELSDRDSSEVEASEVAPDVVCISDEEVKSKKKKKKDKKCKKSKKSKKNKDFRESADQNFYTETSDKVSTQINDNKDVNSKDVVGSEILNNKDDSSNSEIISIPDTKKTDESNSIKTEISHKSDIDDDVYEILELSDDSSCYEVEEISISKEPTAEEIEALSAKIDEIEKDRTINIDESEGDKRSDTEDLEHVSWKDRYLKSTKVKKVLNTANILNVIRKKNLELKKKLQESKIKSHTESEVIEEVPSNNLEEGSIKQYNTLETCNKYVDPVKDDNEIEIKDPVTQEMKKDAKQLLKMYKMLLKYNDITKEKDMSKKKKKKKKSKDKEKSQPNVDS